MPPARKQCKFRTTRANKRCPHPALPGRYHCALHGQRFVSTDPEARQRQLDNLKLGRAVPANKHLRKVFAVEPTALADKVQDIGEQVLMRAPDGSVPSNLRRTVLRAAKIEVELDWLETLPSLTVRQERRREVLEKRLDIYGERLGMSTDARVKTAALAKEQELAKLRSAKPNRRDPLHMKQVIGMALRSGQFNAAATQWAAKQDPDGTGRRILLNAEELASLSPVEPEPPDEAPDTPKPSLAAVQPQTTTERQ